MCDLSVHPRASAAGILFRGVLGGVQSSGKTRKMGLGSPTRPWGTTARTSSDRSLMSKTPSDVDPLPDERTAVGF